MSKWKSMIKNINWSQNDFPKVKQLKRSKQSSLDESNELKNLMENRNFF